MSPEAVMIKVLSCGIVMVFYITSIQSFGTHSHTVLSLCYH